MEKMEKINFNEGTYYLLGYYVQDFDAPKQIVNEKTGEVTEIDLHRVLLQFIDKVDEEKWGVNKAVGSTVLELPVQLSVLPSVFGKKPNEFTYSEIDKLLNCPVQLVFNVSKKGKATLRGVIAL